MTSRARARFRIKVRTLVFPANGPKIAFPHPVAEVLPIKGYLIVLIEPPRRSPMKRNVYGLDDQGRVRWRIPGAAGPFAHLYRAGPNVEVQAWEGSIFTIDPATGRITDIQWQHR